MARPHQYTIIDTVQELGGKERSTIGVDRMYAIKNGEHWVMNQIKDLFMGHRKYHRMVYANRTSAQTQCDKLNDRYNCIEYRVVRIVEDY